MTKEIEFKYQPRAWQRDVLKALATYQRAVLVAHRRAGKTELLVLRLLIAAMQLTREHPAPLFGYISPFLNQAKATCWVRLKYYAGSLLANKMAKIDEADLSITLWNGSAIRLFGADYPDRLRGLGFDGVVMDEVAQMKADTWSAVVLPALSDRKGWAVFIGTPKGQNIFYDIYQEHLDDDKWYVGTFSADKTDIFNEEEREDLRIEMGDNLYRQEYQCDFTADNEDGFIDYGRVVGAMGRDKPSFNPAPLIMGVDIAAQGADRSCIAIRRGQVLEEIKTWKEANTMKSVGLIAEAIDHWRPRVVFMDSIGLGMGPIDRLKELGYRIVGINSGGTPSNIEKFANLKAEMWWKMNDWLIAGSLPKDDALMKDLLAPKRDYDARNKIMVEKKKHLKARLKFSTDLADAVALTFAQPVSSDAVRDRRPKIADDDWV